MKHKKLIKDGNWYKLILIKIIMKKFTAICFTTFFISSAANATGFFVGADALTANSRQTSTNFSDTSGSRNGIVKEDDNKLNYGLNAGFRLDCMKTLQSVEVFYDNLNLPSSQFASPNSVSDHIKIQNRYGAKINLGFEVAPNVIPFLTVGLTNISYTNSGSSDNINFSRHDFTPIYGLGLLMDISHGISLKLAYDYQKFNIPSTQSDAKIKTNLGVARVGLVYNF